MYVTNSPQLELLQGLRVRCWLPISKYVTHNIFLGP